jgi:hypothetical protein
MTIRALGGRNCQAETASEPTLCAVDTGPRPGWPTNPFKPKQIRSGPSGLFGGPDFKTAYGAGATELGNGQTVALVEFDDYFPGDATAYRNQFGLPNVPVQKKTFDKFNGPPGTGNGEVTLDIDMAMSMARPDSTPSSSTKANSQTAFSEAWHLLMALYCRSGLRLLGLYR